MLKPPIAPLAILLLSAPLSAAAQQASDQVFGNEAITAHLRVQDKHLLLESIEAGGNATVLKPLDAFVLLSNDHREIASSAMDLISLPEVTPLAADPQASRA